VPTVGVFAAIFDQCNHILCVKRAYGNQQWTLPGGKMEPGEAPDDALVREVEEETGFVIRVTHLIGIYATPAKDDLVLYFRADPLRRGCWQSNGEIAQVEFFAQESLPHPLSSKARVRIHDAFERQTGVLSVFAAKGGKLR